MKFEYTPNELIDIIAKYNNLPNGNYKMEIQVISVRDNDEIAYIFTFIKQD